MTEETAKRYIAFSEDSLAEQIAKLTEIANQQAGAIQNLSASIAQLSSNRFARPVEPQPAIKVNPGTAHTPARTITAVVASSSASSTPKPSVASRSVTPMKRPVTHTNGNGSELKSSSPVASGSKKPRVPAAVPRSSQVSGAGMARVPPPAPRVHDEASETAKDTLMGYLEALRNSYPFEECCAIVRARLCSDWMALRPEELLAKLRAVGMETSVRKDFMNLVMEMGPDIVRGRSVKFGRDTRRAVAIPRSYFSAEELKTIDNNFLVPHGKDVEAEDEEEEAVASIEKIEDDEEEEA